MQGYTKLFQSIITSTVWQESNDAKAVWVTMLALKDGDHVCRATIPALAKLNNLTIQQTEEILAKFQGPDPYSRSKEFDGRRIERCSEGWVILNGEKYQRRMDEDARREYKRLKAKEYRYRERRVDNRGQKLNEMDKVDKSDTQDTASASASASASIENKEQNLSPSAQETRIEPVGSEFPEENLNPPPKKKNLTDSEIHNLLADFEMFWKEYPKKKARALALKAWKKAKITNEIEKVMSSLRKQKQSEDWLKSNGQFVPYPATWINGRRWEDEIQSTEPPWMDAW